MTNDADIGHNKWKRSNWLCEITPERDMQTVIVSGWVHELRNLGNIAFLKIRDRTGFAQITLVKDECSEELFMGLTGLSRESVVSVKGTVKTSQQAKMGVEIIPEAYRSYSVSQTPLPLGVADKVYADMDTRLDNRFLDLRRPEVQAVFKIRDTIMGTSQNFLRSEGFMEVHTPKIVATATEGGTDLFSIKYFDHEAYLNQSPQLFKQILMGSGMDRVFEIGPAFRAEKHDTVRHVNEFISLDIEMSFSDEEDAMSVLERLIHRIYQDVIERNSHDIELIMQLIKRYNHHTEQENAKIRKENKALKKENKKLKKAGLPLKPYLPLKELVTNTELKVPDLPFPRLTYYDSIKMINSSIDRLMAEAAETSGNTETIPHKLEWGDDPGLEHFKLLAEEMPGLYFLTQWPLTIKPFYVHPYDADDRNPDLDVSRGFDLMFGYKEITSGAQRVHELELLTARIREKGLDPDDFEFYLKPFAYGMPPHSGWGLGIERLMMMITSLYNIRECILFPRDRDRLVP